MAYALNTSHALYGNLIELIGVDAGALVSLKTARTFTVASGASFGTGTYGAHFSSVGAGFTATGATFTPGIAIDNGIVPNTTVFVVMNALTTAGGSGPYALLTNSANSRPSIGLGANNEGVAYNGNVPGATGTANLSTGAHMLAMTRTGETAHELYVDSTAAVTGGQLGFNSSAVDYTNIGGVAGQFSVAASFVWIAVFNRVLTSTEISNLCASVAAGNVIGLVGASSAPASFTGTVPTQAGAVGTTSSLALASYFSGTFTPFVYSVFSGTLPAGLSLNTSTGVISGTPTAAGTAAIVVRATDTAANTANSNSFTMTTSAVAGITITDPLKNNTGTLLANQTGVRVAVVQAVDLAAVYVLVGTTTNASGLLPTISNGAIVTGTSYNVVIKLADGSVGVTQAITAS